MVLALVPEQLVMDLSPPCLPYLSIPVLAETQRCGVRGSLHAEETTATLWCCSSVSRAVRALHAGGSESRTWVLQGAAAKADAAKKEAAKKEIAELMAKAQADMDKQDKKEDATAAKDKAEDLQKEVSID